MSIYSALLTTTTGLVLTLPLFLNVPIHIPHTTPDRIRFAIRLANKVYKIIMTRVSAYLLPFPFGPHLTASSGSVIV